MAEACSAKSQSLILTVSLRANQAEDSESTSTTLLNIKSRHRNTSAKILTFDHSHHLSTVIRTTIMPDKSSFRQCGKRTKQQMAGMLSKLPVIVLERLFPFHISAWEASSEPINLFLNEVDPRSKENLTARWRDNMVWQLNTILISVSIETFLETLNNRLYSATPYNN